MLGLLAAERPSVLLAPIEVTHPPSSETGGFFALDGLAPASKRSDALTGHRSCGKANAGIETALELDGRVNLLQGQVIVLGYLLWRRAGEELSDC